MGGENSPAVQNGGAPIYDRAICYDSPVDYDSGLFAHPSEQTLAELRKRLLRRLGFAAQANNPPPGMKELLDDFLQDAQQQLYWKYDVLRTERFWTWQTEAGKHLYDVPIDCTKFLEFRKISAAHLQDGQQWYPLHYGIDPVLYTSTQTTRPYRFELREYIEVWPVPDVSTYLIRIKGHIGLKRFVQDSDRPTIDTEAVFLHALARAKAHYEQRDGSNYERDLERLIGNLVAGSHVTRRYIPGSMEPVPPPRPVIVE